jgi:hypothetical protein
LREFLSRGRGKAIILSARAYPLGETAAFGVWSEALERYLRGLGREDVSRLCGGFLDDLAEGFAGSASLGATSQRVIEHSP